LHTSSGRRGSSVDQSGFAVGGCGGSAPNPIVNEMMYQETYAVPPVGGPQSVSSAPSSTDSVFWSSPQSTWYETPTETPIWAPYWKGSQEIRKSADAVSQARTLPSWKSTCIPPPPITHDGVSAK
jgi:hypothetical protein